MKELTLAQRLLVRIGQISRRSDVIVRQQTTPWGSGRSRIAKWQGKLPADMFAFYNELNGIQFHYSFADDPSGYHGLEFVALNDDGRKTIDTLRRTFRIPRQAAKRFPEYFFQPGDVEANKQVLFFFGDDSAWGVLMIGEGESASFHHWDNDGFVKYLSGSFTELVERLIARGFAHTWAYSDSHPITDDVLRRLAIEAPPRKSFELTIEAIQPWSAADRRKVLITSWSEEQRGNALKALGLAKQAKGASPEDVIAMIEGAVATLEPITEKVAAGVMRSIGFGKRDRAFFASYFRCDTGPMTVVRLRLKYLKGPIPLEESHATLVRVLHSIEGFHVTDGLPFPSEVIELMNPDRRGFSFEPFISCAWAYKFHGNDDKEAIFTLVLDPARAEGMEVGKTYTSTALPSVEARIE